MHGTAYNVTSIYDIENEESNVPKGKGVARSVYVVLYDRLCLFHIMHYLPASSAASSIRFASLSESTYL